MGLRHTVGTDCLAFRDAMHDHTQNFKAVCNNEIDVYELFDIVVQ